MQFERTIARVQSTGTVLTLLVLLATLSIVPLSSGTAQQDTAPCGDLSAAALRSLDQSLQTARLRPLGRTILELLPQHPTGVHPEADPLVGTPELLRASWLSAGAEARLDGSLLFPPDRGDVLTC